MTVPWGDNKCTQTDDKAFMEIIITELREMSHQFKEHLWSKAMYIIQNNNSLGGQPFNDSGLFNPGVSINATVVEWWCTWNNSHGYGIFHSWKWEANQLVVVSLYYMSSLCF